VAYGLGVLIYVGGFLWGLLNIPNPKVDENKILPHLKDRFFANFLRKKIKNTSIAWFGQTHQTPVV